MRIEALTSIVSELGEGPVWDVATERIYWIDAVAPGLHSTTLTGHDARSWSLPSRVGSFALAENDESGAVVALTEGLHRLDFETGATVRLGAVDDVEGTWLNDGKVDRQGRFIVGSMDASEASAIGGIFAWGPGRSAQRLDAGYICSNGPCWSPAGDVFYCADSWERKIYKYSYDPSSGEVGSRDVFIDVGEYGGGVPDGCTVDAEGFLWSANLFGGRVLRFTPEGTLDRIVEVPVTNLTSVSFGGPDLDVLLVTSMGNDPRPGLTDQSPLRGRLLAVYGLGHQGVPERRMSSK